MTSRENFLTIFRTFFGVLRVQSPHWVLSLAFTAQLREHKTEDLTAPWRSCDSSDIPARDDPGNSLRADGVVAT